MMRRAGSEKFPQTFINSFQGFIPEILGGFHLVSCELVEPCGEFGARIMFKLPRSLQESVHKVNGSPGFPENRRVTAVEATCEDADRTFELILPVIQGAHNLRQQLFRPSPVKTADAEVVQDEFLSHAVCAFPSQFPGRDEFIAKGLPPIFFIST